MHPRAAIRERVQAALIEGNTAAGSKVYRTRMVPWREVEAPALAVYTLDEDVDESTVSSAPRILHRMVDLAIEIMVQQTAAADVDTQMDEIARQVERIMADNTTLPAEFCEDYWMTGTQSGVFTEGEHKFGVMVLSYSVEYRDDAWEEMGADAPYFLRAGIRYAVNGQPLDVVADQAGDLALVTDPPLPRDLQPAADLDFRNQRYRAQG